MAGTTTLFLPDPWIEAQKYNTSCWAAALVSWAQTTHRGPQVSLSQDDLIQKYEGQSKVNPDGSLISSYEVWRAVTADFGCNRWENRKFAELTPDKVLRLIRLHPTYAGTGSGYVLVEEIEPTPFRHVYVVYGYTAAGDGQPWWWAMNPDSRVTAGTMLASAPIPASPGRWAGRQSNGIPSAGSISEFRLAWFES